jgi:hypothetical protein
MIEQKIDDLNKNLKDLTDVVLFFTELLRDKWNETTTTGIPAPEPPAPEPTTPDPSTDTPDPNDLQALCLKIVRADKNKGKEIKAILAELGGALIKDLPAGKLPILKERLEALS